MRSLMANYLCAEHRIHTLV